MRLLDVDAVRKLLTPDVFNYPVAVRDILIQGGWHIGAPTANPAEFDKWLKHWDAPNGMDGGFDNSKRVFALAVHYFTRRHSRAEPLALAGAAGQLAGLATGWPVSFGQEGRDPRFEWVERAVMGILGGGPGQFGPGSYMLPAELVEGGVVPGMDAPAQATMVLRLLDCLYFTPLPDPDWPRRRAIVRETHRLLGESRKSFKSKLVARARELLEILVPKEEMPKGSEAGIEDGENGIAPAP